MFDSSWLSEQQSSGTPIPHFELMVWIRCQRNHVFGFGELNATVERRCRFTHSIIIFDAAPNRRQCADALQTRIFQKNDASTINHVAYRHYRFISMTGNTTQSITSDAIDNVIGHTIVMDGIIIDCNKANCVHGCGKCNRIPANLNQIHWIFASWCAVPKNRIVI